MDNKKPKILIIEDESDISEALRLRLEANGYDVITSSDGVEGLHKAHAERPDLIILDIRLPKMDGYKVCRMLKFDEEYSSTTVIILTARIQPSDIAMGKEVGADEYMTKPYRSEELLAKIKQYLVVEG